MDRGEFARRLTRATELADDGAVEFDLVDFAGNLRAGGGRAVLPRVRHVEELFAGNLRPWTARDADCPRVAHAGVIRLEVQVVVEHLHARVAAITDVDVAREVRGDGVRGVELEVLVATSANRLHE